MKGATLEQHELELTDDISIHAPVKGATERGLIEIYSQDDFNPRSREGSDMSFLYPLLQC